MEGNTEVVPQIHDMIIKPEYFYMVKDGIKKYEARTNDSRRRIMRVGDYIKLMKEPELTEVIWLRITNKIEFDTFTELYDALPKRDVGFEGRTTESIVQELRRFYTEEKERETGVVAIEVELAEEPEIAKKPITRRLTQIRRTF